MSVVSFNYGTQLEYDSIVKAEAVDLNALYFVLDTQRIYRGTTPISITSVFFKDELPSVESALENTFYVIGRYVYLLVEGEFVCVNRELVAGAINSLTLFDTASTLITSADSFEDTDNKLMTASAVKSYVNTAVPESVEDAFVGASWGADSGQITFSKVKGDPELLNLTGLAHNVQYDSESYRITIPIYGSEDVVVNIPKCVKSGRYEANYLLPDGTHGPAIVLVVDAPGEPSGEMEIVIPAAALIQTYVGSDTDSISLTVSDAKVISAHVRISPAESRIIATSDGLSLDLSDFAMKSNPADVGKVAIIDADGNYKGDRKILSEYHPESTELDELLPTLGVVSSVISEALATISSKILSQGDPNKVIISTETGIVRSGYSVGGDTLDPNSTEELLATEKAVLDAISWKGIL